LMRNRNLEEVQVHLSLMSGQAAFHLAQTRDWLMKLPKINEFRMDWCAGTVTDANFSPEECLIDDTTLLRIVSHTNRAELDKGICTAQGIFSAFEMVCQSPSKFVSLDVPNTTAKKLFAMPNLGLQ
ncbi:hypothetical protein PMAYCL1PPCAC_11651, partial [Pristionchus mayeri]